MTFLVKITRKPLSSLRLTGIKLVVLTHSSKVKFCVFTKSEINMEATVHQEIQIGNKKGWKALSIFHLSQARSFSHSLHVFSQKLSFASQVSMETGCKSWYHGQGASCF